MYTLNDSTLITDAFDEFTVVEAACAITYDMSVSPITGASIFTFDPVLRTVSIYADDSDLTLAINSYTITITALDLGLAARNSFSF